MTEGKKLQLPGLAKGGVYWYLISLWSQPDPSDYYFKLFFEKTKRLAGVSIRCLPAWLKVFLVLVNQANHNRFLAGLNRINIYITIYYTDIYDENCLLNVCKYI